MDTCRLTEKQYVEYCRLAAIGNGAEPSECDDEQVRLWCHAYWVQVRATPTETSIPLRVLRTWPDALRWQIIRGNPDSSRTWQEFIRRQDQERISGADHTK